MNPPTTERAILVGLDLTGKRFAMDHSTAEESLKEFSVLAESAGACVLETILQTRVAPDASTLVGSGKLEEIQHRVKALEASLVLVDRDLSGMQQRNLEKALDCKVVDRTQLILDIFARRARTREGQLQVELAQLNYMLPRLTGKGTSLSRLGGGIGTRGPGETKLETDRRRIHRRIKRIEDSLRGVRATRGVQRSQRQSVPLLTMALVGYTNAGKSTLFNRLTGAAVLADARMFATLDPTVRHLSLPSRRKVLLSDTVGFIRQLPATLVEAFRATLEEVRQAAVLLHVIDCTAPAAVEHCAHVRGVLNEIDARQSRQLLVLNKCDLLDSDADARRALAARLSGESGGVPAVFVSAHAGTGIGELLAKMDELLPADPVERVRFRFPLAEAGLAHQLHELAVVVHEEYDHEGIDVVAEAPASVVRRFARFSTAILKDRETR